MSSRLILAAGLLAVSLSIPALAQTGGPPFSRGVARTPSRVYLDPPRFSAVRAVKFTHTRDLVSTLTSARDEPA